MKLEKVVEMTEDEFGVSNVIARIHIQMIRVTTVSCDSFYLELTFG